MHLERKQADFREVKLIANDMEAALWEGEAIIARSTFKARISWFFSSENPPEERLECFIESDDNILQYLRVNLSQKRMFFF